jgi:hypothetical protein
LPSVRFLSVGWNFGRKKIMSENRDTTISWGGGEDEHAQNLKWIGDGSRFNIYLELFDMSHQPLCSQHSSCLSEHSHPSC